METNKVKFNYIKRDNYKTFHADGIIGGITPKGKIVIDFFIERGVIPRIVEHEVDKDGNVNNEKYDVIESRDGLIRQIDAGVIMDVGTAKALQGWLDKQIKKIEIIDKEKK